MVRGPSRELAPKHSTMVPSTMEASDSEVRVTVRDPLMSVRTPRNAGVPCVTSVLLALKDMLNTAPSGGAMSHRMRLPGRVQVKVTMSSGQATVGMGVSGMGVVEWVLVWLQKQINFSTLNHLC